MEESTVPFFETSTVTLLSPVFIFDSAEGSASITCITLTERVHSFIVAYAEPYEFFGGLEDQP